MNRIRGGAIILGLALLGVASVARAQVITGGVVGRVTDRDTALPLGGVTVILQGPQGEDASLTDEHGDYSFSNVQPGNYVLRFYVANAASQVEQPGVIVAAERTIRVNMKLAAPSAAAPQQTYVVTGKAPTIDIGSTRVQTQFDQEFMNNVPIGRTYGDLIEKAPGAFIDGSNNVSIAGATGLENIYIVNGLNVTGLRFGNLEYGGPTIGGGTNVPVEFLHSVDVNTGGYEAEYGGAMGGVINTLLKSGTNQLHAEAFGYWSPYWLAGNPKPIVPVGSALGGFRKPDFDDSFGIDVGGPIIKDRLFFWVGLAPRLTDTYFLRTAYAQVENPNMPGTAQIDPATGLPVTNQIDWTARVNETHRTYYYAGTLDWLPLPDNKLTVAVMGTPSFNNQLKQQYGVDTKSSNPDWMSESLTKTNTDVTARWVSKLFDRHWQIEAFGGMHSEYFYDRAPNAALNGLNELQYSGANLWDLEHAPGCEPTASGFQPCPVNPFYQTGGFGEIDKYTGYRWSGEIKSTHLFNGGGPHELKWGWHVDLGTFDLDRYYSGPVGSRAFVQLFPGSNGITSWTFFKLQQGESPLDYTMGKSDPIMLTQPPRYVDDLSAKVESLSNAFFLQDSYSPSVLRNLTLNVGARYELQRIAGSDGVAFLDTSNISPRLGAIYDPLGDGRSKVSVAYGRYYEQVPLDIAARYFAGENFVQGFGSLTGCPGGLSNPYSWTGNAEYTKCGPPGGALPTFNSEFAQPNLQGQYHNEIVATAEREVIQDLVVRLDYQHRWLGSIIEDGYGPGFGPGVLANPGHVPGSAIDEATRQRDQTAAALAAAAPTDPNYQALTSAANTAAYNLATLQQLGAMPTPERTYDALTLSLRKRFSKNWMTRASYTYSRLIGNYEGLYQNETNYIAPNGGNAYDLPELAVNANGPLPNDRPHLFRLDGFYNQPVGRGHFTGGLSFVARSGMPRNYIGNLAPGSAYQLVFLLPRGSAGRTPTVTQFDLKFMYGRPLTANVNFEAFIDIFNLFNQQTAILVDDNYTFDAAPPIQNGTVSDLPFAKNVFGQPVAKNPNFGQPLAYQAPISGRLGLRLTF
jgi:hypothetical protein